MTELENLSDALDGLEEEAKNTVILAVQDELQGRWRVPPMLQMTQPGTDEFAFINAFPSILKEESGVLDYDLVDRMMSTGQIAYPMALKKAPISTIVRSPSGFTVECSDERMKDLLTKNLQQVLQKRIDEVLTMLEYGAYYAEITYEIGWPQDYGLNKSTVPFWIIEDFNGCHPTTIEKILRNKRTKAFEGFVQAPPDDFRADRITVGTERALIIPHNGLFGKLEGQSILQPVHVWWFWYELVWRAFLRYLQRQGVGVVIVKAPSRGRVEVNGKYVDNMSWALQTASSLHRTNYAALPSDADPDSNQPLWSVEYLKMGNEEGKQFIEALKLLADNIKNFLLTGSSTSQDGGEFEVMLDTERTLAHIAMYLNNYVVPKYLMWNGSKTRVATLDFQGANSRVLPLIFKLLAVAGNTTGDALQNVDWRLLMAEGGVPVLSEEEVEELQEKKFEDMERVRQINQPQQEEKAKMPPGGEGRWASQRDKEGRRESLEMIAQALGASTLALTAPQVATLEEMGIRADDKPVVLFNPYHDRVGQFTDKAHATKPMPKNKFASYDVDDRTTFLADDAASLAYERMKESPKKVLVYGKKNPYVNALCSTYPAKHKIACARRSPRAYSIYRDGKIYVSPKGAKAIKKDRKFGEYMLSHEALHSRKRSDGREGVDVSFDKVGVLKKDPSYQKAMARYHLEEGATDLLARQMNSLDQKYTGEGFFAGAPAYMKQMGAIAILAGIASDWDRAEAWRLINLMHYNINDDTYIFDLLSKAFGTPANGWDGSSYYALLVSLQKTAADANYAELGWLFGDME